MIYTAEAEKAGSHECELSFYVSYADTKTVPPASTPSGRLKAIIEITGQPGANADVINVGGIVGSLE